MLALWRSCSAAFEIDDLFNPEWRSEVALYLAFWTVTYEDNLARVPPDRYTELHAKYLSGLELLNSAAYDYATAFDDVNPDLIDVANEKVLQASPIIEEVITEVAMELEQA